MPFSINYTEVRPIPFSVRGVEIEHNKTKTGVLVRIFCVNNQGDEFTMPFELINPTAAHVFTCIETVYRTHNMNYLPVRDYTMNYSEFLDEKCDEDYFDVDYYHSHIVS